MPVQPAAEPFHAAGSRTGVLLVHGFTGSPYSMRPWAEHLAAEGYTVSLPRLPGHGTTWQQMNATTWQDWYAEACRALDELLGRLRRGLRGRPVDGWLPRAAAGRGAPRRRQRADAGQPVGAQHQQAAARRPGAQARWSGRSRASPTTSRSRASRSTAMTGCRSRALDSLRDLWKLTREDLPKVTAPLVLFRSSVDHVVEPQSAQLIMQRVSSRDVTERILDDSYHVATLDNDAAAHLRRVGGVHRQAHDAAAAASDRDALQRPDRRHLHARSPTSTRSWPTRCSPTSRRVASRRTPSRSSPRRGGRLRPARVPGTGSRTGCTSTRPPADDVRAVLGRPRPRPRRQQRRSGLGADRGRLRPPPGTDVTPWPENEDLSPGRRPGRRARSAASGRPRRTRSRSCGGAADAAGTTAPTTTTSWPPRPRPRAPTNEDDDVDPADRFVPPDPPPLPKLQPYQLARLDRRDRRAGAAGALGAVLLHLPPLLLALAIVGFIGGFVTLVATMGNGRDDDWDPGNGAVV